LVTARSDPGMVGARGRPSGPDHPGTAGRTAEATSGPRLVEPAAGHVSEDTVPRDTVVSPGGVTGHSERTVVPPPAGRRGQGGWYRGAATGAPRPSSEAVHPGQRSRSRERRPARVTPAGGLSACRTQPSRNQPSQSQLGRNQPSRSQLSRSRLSRSRLSHGQPRRRHLSHVQARRPGTLLSRTYRL
jgi:hypothetical protein